MLKGGLVKEVRVRVLGLLLHLWSWKAFRTIGIILEGSLQWMKALHGQSLAAKDTSQIFWQTCWRVAYGNRQCQLLLSVVLGSATPFLVSVE